MRYPFAFAALAILSPAAPSEETPFPGAGFVRGRVMGKDGTLLGVPVRVFVDGKEVAQCRSDINGRYRVEAPPGEFDLEACPESWTRLDPIRRRLAVAPRTETVEDFVLGGIAGAFGHIQGASGDRPLTLLATRVDAPGPKLVAIARGTFTFRGLEAGATYRIDVEGDEWGSEQPVLLRAGDTGIALRIERLLNFVVEASDIEGRGPLAMFRVLVVDRDGQVSGEIQVRDGRLVHRVRHPEQVPPSPPDLPPGQLETALEELRAAVAAGAPLRAWPSLNGEPPPPWKIVVEADGFLPATGSTNGTQHLYLQRARKPNVVLLVHGDEGVPVEGTFEAAERPDGRADAHVARDAPGRFRATLPPGAWRLTLSRGGEAGVQVRVDVPESGTVTVEAPRLPRGKP